MKAVREKAERGTKKSEKSFEKVLDKAMET